MLEGNEVGRRETRLAEGKRGWEEGNEVGRRETRLGGGNAVERLEGGGGTSGSRAPRYNEHTGLHRTDNIVGECSHAFSSTTNGHETTFMSRYPYAGISDLSFEGD